MKKSKKQKTKERYNHEMVPKTLQSSQCTTLHIIKDQTKTKNKRLHHTMPYYMTATAQRLLMVSHEINDSFSHFSWIRIYFNLSVVLFDRYTRCRCRRIWQTKNHLGNKRKENKIQNRIKGHGRLAELKKNTRHRARRIKKRTMEKVVN